MSQSDRQNGGDQRSRPGHDALDAYASRILSDLWLWDREGESNEVVELLLAEKNPLLVGPRGAGKTAMIRGLAADPARVDRVPAPLRGRLFVEPNLPALRKPGPPGDTPRDRLLRLLDVPPSHDGFILVLDGLEDVAAELGLAGAAELVAVVRQAPPGVVRVIATSEGPQGAAGLGRLGTFFSVVPVHPLGVEDTISVLRGEKERLERRYGVRVDDKAVVAAAVRAGEYRSPLALPGKALDLADRVAARRRRVLDSGRLAEFDALEGRRMQLEIERVVLAQEPGAGAHDRIAGGDRELSTINARIESIRSILCQIQDVAAELARRQDAADDASRRGDRALADRILTVEIPGLEAEREELLRRDPAVYEGLREYVDDSDVAAFLDSQASPGRPPGRTSGNRAAAAAGPTPRARPVEMDGRQVAAFRDALCSAFDQSALDQMLRLGLDKDRQRLVADGPREQVVFDLIGVAQREGWLRQLIDAACEYAPGNLELESIRQQCLSGDSG